MSRPYPRVIAVLALAAALLAWSALTGYVWTDYEAEVERPLGALLDGHLSSFLASAPGYGGSLILRAPFALLTSALGGGDVAVYRAMAVPCLLAGAVLGLVLYDRRRTAFPAARWPTLFAVLAVASPITFRALEIGHPEELFGAVLCAGAVLAAISDRPWLAAVLLGAALGNKMWAVLAIGPVLVALDRHRLRVLIGAGVIGAALTVPFLLAQGGGQVGLVAAHTSSIFQPWQIWWPLGDTGQVILGGNGHVKVDYRAMPGGLAAFSHPLIALLGPPLTALWWWRRRGTAFAREDALLLLAFVFLLRCLLDTWNFSYYHLPLATALLCWEAIRHERPPVLTLTLMTFVWVTWEKLPGVLPPDAQSAAYVVPALLFGAWMAGTAYRTSANPSVSRPPGARYRLRARSAQA